MTLLSNRIGDYFYISQGKTRIPGVNDAEDMEDTDVSPKEQTRRIDPYPAQAPPPPLTATTHPLSRQAPMSARITFLSKIPIKHLYYFLVLLKIFAFYF
jgi:hypothetical protein